MARQEYVRSGPFGDYTGYYRYPTQAYNSPCVNVSQENSSCTVGVLLRGQRESQIEQQMANSTVQPATLAEVTVKVINPKKARDYKIFVLRDLDIADIQTRDNFRCIIYRQFGGTVVSSELDFGFGYFKVQSEFGYGLSRIGRLFYANFSGDRAPMPLTLWCEGKKSESCKRQL